MGGNPHLDGVEHAKCPEAPGTSSTVMQNAIRVYYGRSKKGIVPFNEHKTNQDRMFMQTDPKTNSVILCVMDGHGEVGHLVSSFIQTKLPKILLNNTSWSTNIPTALKQSIQQVEQMLQRDTAIQTQFSGSTLVMAVIRNNTLYTANVGDSRCILAKTISNMPGNATWLPEQITIDHKPDLPKEKERIVKSGGRVFCVTYPGGIVGPPRVFLKAMDIPGLAMSRSLGDEVSHSVGVSAIPDITTRELLPTDKAIILASDGLWEFITNNEVVAMCAKRPHPKDAVDVMMKQSEEKWLKNEQVVDDTTIIVAYLDVKDVK